jgi:oligoendopeptidase F
MKNKTTFIKKIILMFGLMAHGIGFCDANQSMDNLPKWDLTDFYKSIDDAQIELDKKSILNDAQQFAKDLKDVDDFLTFESVQKYESINERLGYIGSFAYLNYTTKSNDPKSQSFLQSIQELDTQITSDLLFFTIKINKIDDLEPIYKKDSKLEKYRPWIDQVRLFKPYQLDEKLEKLLLEKAVTGRHAWVRLYDETAGGMEFDYDGKKLTESKILSLLSNADEKIRKKAAESLSQGIKEHSSTFIRITNTLAKDKQTDDQLRGFKTCVSSRNLENQVEDHVVDALVSTVKKNYKNLSHRYYKLKAKWMKKDKIEYWDRGAPLPNAEDVKISFDEAKKIVLEAYTSFHPDIAAIAKKFMDNNWIDVPSYPGKTAGAYSHSTVPSVHPYIFLNYQGRQRDVMTLAHELGHGIHQTLASSQGYMGSQTPLTIAETASVFGEMLTFQELLRRAKTDAQKKSLLASKVEDMLGTAVRQIAFFDFEYQVHTKRIDGELSESDLNAIWMKTIQESLGDSVNMDPIVNGFWQTIPHFIHSPFYVYSYAFGDCLVNSLFKIYQSKSVPNFENLYIDLLKSGGTKGYKELLQPFGLRAQDPEFWQQGLDMISSLIDELEKMD